MMDLRICFGLFVIIVIYYLQKCRETFVLDDEMNMNESSNIMNRCKFSLSCCPSIYSNDRGCMCIDEEVEEVLKTRGYNKTKVDGFGY